ncbi:MAG TPA: hypothetical protein VF226_15215 [Hyphomicrobiaceae bacterium]
MLLFAICPAVASAEPNSAVTASPAPVEPAVEAPEKANLTVQTFLDRLMMAESGGLPNAKNPRSTALGPFQFIESTFLEVARRYFADEVAGLSDAEILAKRTDFEFSRRAALAYTRENAAHLGSQGLEVTSVALRLAFLLGPAGATRLLRADEDTPVSAILSSEVLAANPFMASMTAADLLRKAALDISGNGRITGLGTGAEKPKIVIRCNLGLASCRRWVALRKRMLARQQRWSQTQ